MDPDSSQPSMPNFQGYQGKKKAREENTWNFSGAKPGGEAHHFWPWSINYDLVTWPCLIAREVEKCPLAICSKKRKKRQPLSHDKPIWKLTLKPEAEWPAKACWGLFDLFPTPSLFWEMNSLPSQYKWLLIHSASFQSTNIAHRRNSYTILPNWQSCVLPSWTHQPGGHRI